MKSATSKWRSQRRSTAFESLERAQQVLTELVGDKSLERFRREYEKLHRALKNHMKVATHKKVS